MSDDRDHAPMKWWGWGDPAKRAELGEEALAALRDELGAGQPAQRVGLEDVNLPEPAPLPGAIAEAVGSDSVLTDLEHRLVRAAGRSYPDLIRLRSGRLDDAPDAVVLPGSAAEVGRVLELCAAEGVAVVPFGGGTSVVGGVDPARGRFERLISLDLGRLRVTSVDHRSLTATLGPGLRGPEAEAALASEGVTLGHFPQSFEYATIGGFAATRSAGQASSGYGRFDALVTSIVLATPAAGAPHPGDASQRRRPRPAGAHRGVGGRARRDHRGRGKGQAGAGAAPLRGLDGGRLRVGERGRAGARSGGSASRRGSRVRSDGDADLAHALREPGAKRALASAYLRLRGRADGAVVIFGWDGDRDSVARRRALATRRLRSAGAAPLGASPGRAWERGRYEGPYLRDELLDLGYLAETLETAHEWSRLTELYEKVRSAIENALSSQGTPGLVMCHLSHAYPDGASLYYTFLGPVEDRRGARAMAGGQGGGLRGDHRGGGDDHPSPRGRP